MNAGCSVDGCGARHEGLGFCRVHYRRFKKHGTPDLIERATAICTECDRPVKAQGLCNLHVQRVYRTGTTRLAQTTLEQRFWAKVDKRGDDECWEWTAHRNPSGHGVLRMPNGNVYAHRLSLQFALGRPIGDGLNACHHCDNPPCVNPAHLYEGTQQDNVDDMWSRGRARPGGHDALTRRSVTS